MKKNTSKAMVWSDDSEYPATWVTENDSETKNDAIFNSVDLFIRKHTINEIYSGPEVIFIKGIDSRQKELYRTLQAKDYIKGVFPNITCSFKK